MSNLKNKKVNSYTKVFALLLLSVFVLASCQQSNNAEQEEPQYFTLPEVTPKYDSETITEFNNRVATNDTNRYEGLVIPDEPLLSQPEQLPSALFYDSGISIPYPEDGVKGVYLTAENVANEEYFNYIIDYINETELNAVVIDFKDDWGNVIPPIETDNEYVQQNVIGSVDYAEVLRVLEENEIYPIARITTFKDNLLAEARPDLSFKDSATGEIWSDGNGSKFINPFSQDAWDYVLTIAEEAAKMGFKDIQFDYIRFPEGFETFHTQLEYEVGEYSVFESDNPDEQGYERVAAINDFLTYADNRLTPYGVEISADIFGYTAVAGDAPDVRGIGQNFTQMAERVDVVSSMIYPSHWTSGFFGFDVPDYYPYEFTNTYIQEELYVLGPVQNDVVSRPWLQDFTMFMEYGPTEVQGQINALAENGIHEYLLWNAAGEYTTGVDYAPDVATAQVTE
ncbi:putative glycoside hydrolase [Ruoffia sp. FAM 24228]|uniref:putative glycoside hydrolase n=1 Tax=Ruoffia sp. FAM 24228 TaxID=3259517 RepID=UPI003889F11D